jgi:mycothiol synthase
MSNNLPGIETTIVLPIGYSAQPVQMTDVEQAVDLINTYFRDQIGADQENIESIRAFWQTPTFHIETDTMAIFTQSGRMVGYSEFQDWGEPHVRLIGWSCVHPEYSGRGLGKYLLEWSIHRAQQNLEIAQSGARVVLHHFIASKNRAAAELFTTYGLQLVRSSYVMRIEFDQEPEPASLPEGITIRAIRGDEEERCAMFAVHEAFKDHWGNTNQPFEEYYTRTKHYLENDPHYDPSLWFIALDGQQITGASFCYSHTEEDPDLAWVGTLGVCRPWRKRGIGLALLKHSFSEFYRRGKKRAGLAVDAGSLTGAVRLYECAGMHILRKSDIYELELRPGKELMRQSADVK